MKEFISGIAMILIFSVFLVQFTVNEITHDKLLFVQHDIETCLQDVKEEGYFSQSIKDKLTNMLEKDLHQNTAEGISITSGKTSPVGRGEDIDYRIEITIKDIYGSPKLLGITDNKIRKTYEGHVSSEWVG